MGEIYQKAREVNVWLGTLHDVDKERMAFTKIAQVAQSAKQFCLGSRGSHERIAKLVSLIRSQPGLSPESSVELDESWDAAYAVLDFPWWSRTWIIQESTGKHNKDIIVFCGTFGLSMDLYLYLRCFLTAANFVVAPDLARRTVFHRHYHTILVIRKEMRRHRRGDNVSSLTILDLFSKSRCEDPRDKVFAALSILNLGTVLHLKADYHKPLNEVYLDVVRGYLNSCEDEYRKLDFLGYAEDGKRNRDEGISLPTWLPDWRRSRCQRPLSAIRRGRPHNSSMLRVPRIDVDEGGLHLQGWLTDAVDIQIANIDKSVLETFINEFLISIEERSRTGVKPGSSLLPTSYNAVPASKAKTKFYVERSARSIDGSDRAWRSSRLGRIGLMPASSQAGDKICVLLGGGVFYVLREVVGTGRHLFIGEAYLQGCMDELALDRPLEDFVLV